MTLSPQAQFQAKLDIAKQWENIAASEAFAEAANYAMLALIQRAMAPDMATAAASQFEIQGARKFLDNLRNLTLNQQPAPQIRAFSNLTQNFAPAT